jgi:hypothetical protein
MVLIGLLLGAMVWPPGDAPSHEPRDSATWANYICGIVGRGCETVTFDHIEVRVERR